MEKYIDIFNQLWDHSENEVVEFKKAETNFDVDELGKYFSALSNEANLRDHEFAWIVFGVWDKKHQIIGTSFKDGEVALNRLWYSGWNSLLRISRENLSWLLMTGISLIM